MTVARMLWALDIMPGVDEEVSLLVPYCRLSDTIGYVLLFCLSQSDADLVVVAQGQEVKLDMWAYTNAENTQPLPLKARFIP
jgi:hypothetical protein